MKPETLGSEQEFLGQVSRLLGGLGPVTYTNDREDKWPMTEQLVNELDDLATMAALLQKLPLATRMRAYLSDGGNDRIRTYDLAFMKYSRKCELDSGKYPYRSLPTAVAN